MEAATPFDQLIRAVQRNIGFIEQFEHACRLLPHPGRLGLDGLAIASRDILDWAAREARLRGGYSDSASQRKPAPTNNEPSPAPSVSRASAERGLARGKRAVGESAPMLFHQAVSVAASKKKAAAAPAKLGAKQGVSKAAPSPAAAVPPAASAERGLTQGKRAARESAPVLFYKAASVAANKKKAAAKAAKAGARRGGSKTVPEAGAASGAAAPPPPMIATSSNLRLLSHL